MSALRPSVQGPLSEEEFAAVNNLYRYRQRLAEDRQTDGFLAAYAKSEPLVTVCVATCNRVELLLERCIPSLRKQSYRNLQIVVVGDHCTDETEQRIAAINDSRIVFENRATRGPYPPPGELRWLVAGTEPMNRALLLAEGDFITHLDDDDEALPQRIEMLVSAAVEHKAEFLWHAFYYQNADDSWKVIGDQGLEFGRVTTGSIFYHRYFAQFPWDVYAFRYQEPGDWNRIRKIRFLNPHRYFIDEPLIRHYKEQMQKEFVAQEGEDFLTT